MLKAKQIQTHKREKENNNNTRQVIIEEKAEFKDKSDTEDNSLGELMQNEENDRPAREENETFNDKSDSEDQSVVESNRNMFHTFLDQTYEINREDAKAEQDKSMKRAQT
eukprot:832022-Heterocapsa_arctica.AAC.1